MYMHVIVALHACSDCEEEEQMSIEWRRERFQREEFLQQQVGFIVFNSFLATDNNVSLQQSRSTHSLLTEEDQSVLNKTCLPTYPR